MAAYVRIICAAYTGIKVLGRERFATAHASHLEPRQSGASCRTATSDGHLKTSKIPHGSASALYSDSTTQSAELTTRLTRLGHDVRAY